MLTLELPEREIYDDDKEIFIRFPPQVVLMEHSLISISKWEAIWHEPYLGYADGRKQEPRTKEQELSYVECMTITKGLDKSFYETLDGSTLKKITDYINNPHTATTFNDKGNGPGNRNRQTITAELIYYWMLKANIPFECEKWHLNKLLTLIRVCDVMDSKYYSNGKKKTGRAELSAYRRKLNASRRQQLNTTG